MESIITRQTDSITLDIILSLQVDPNSIAAKDGRIREGDRIVQVNMFRNVLTDQDCRAPLIATRTRQALDVQRVDRGFNSSRVWYQFRAMNAAPTEGAIPRLGQPYIVAIATFRLDPAG